MSTKKIKKPVKSAKERAAAAAERKKAKEALVEMPAPDMRAAGLQPWLRKDVTMSQEEYTDQLLLVRQLLAHRMTFQDERTAAGNQRGVTRTGAQQNLANMAARRVHPKADKVLESFIGITTAAIKSAEAALEDALMPLGLVYQWLRSIPGVGMVAAAHILAHVDPYVATTVSKLWQYFGFNPGMVMGKKRVKAAAYRENMGQVIGKYVDADGVTTDYMVQTAIPIRADKRTKGFLCPYNGLARRGLAGVVADTWIKNKNNPYVRGFYYPYKNRLAHSDNLTREWNAKTDTFDMVPWRDVSPGHRHAAARRYMMKMFLQDLYVVWRTQLGLEVRKPYAEEYLGKVHHGSTAFDNVPIVDDADDAELAVGAPELEHA